MQNINNKKFIILTLIFFLILILGLFRKVNYSYAQEEEKSLGIPRSSDLEEFFEIIGKKENITSIEIDLGSSKWNLTNIELNFTNIKQERSIVPVEENFRGVTNYIYYTSILSRRGMGVEFYLSEPTTLYGTYIYGWKESAAQEVAVQIRNYDDISNEPGSFIWYSQPLNISIIPDWYLQNFTSSISLPMGKYYLVLYNSSYNVDSRIYWAYNNVDPKNSSLHISEFRLISWGNVIQNSSYLFKLIQKVDKLYNPEEIRMQVEINGRKYNITNGILPNTGNLTLTKINFSPGIRFLNIPIYNNDSIILNYTVDYRINLKSVISTQGSGDGGDNGGGNGKAVTVTGIDPILVFTVSLIIIISIVAGLTSYQIVKRIKTKHDLYLKKLHNKFMDILSLNYIMIIDKKTGINVYEQFFAGKFIDATLISGFLEAIRNFGIELTETYQQSQTVKLEYQNSKILMSEFRDFRIILVLKENVSDDFITSINALAYDIETRYGAQIKDFKGETTAFEGIKNVIEKHLNLSFISPLKIFDLPTIKKTPTQQLMINKAKSIMQQNNSDFFYTTFLIEDQQFDRKKIEAIFNLIEKKIFQPINLPSKAGN